MQNDIVDIASKFNPNVFEATMCYLMAQLVGFLHNINIWGYFWPKLGFLTPWGAHFLGSPNSYAIDIEDIASRFNPNVLLWLLYVI